jgi:M6 family metalloprotease-like protein
VPALDKPFLITQPDGESFQARLRGDEWYNWTENLYGYAIEKGEDGVWYYVDTSVPPQPEAGMTSKHPLTGARAQDPPLEGLKKFVPPRDAGPPREDFEQIAYAPPKGAFNGNVLLILAQFNDMKGRIDPEAWNNDAPGRLSRISHYYGKASYGLVTLSSARESKSPANDGVIGWLNVSARLKKLEIQMKTVDQSGNHPNTGGSLGGEAGTKLRLLAKAAILEADPYINYARYDADGNGTITPDELAIQVVVAGYDGAGGTVPGDSKSVWAHAWFIPSGSIGSIGLPVVDGKKISKYSMVGELHGGPRHQATMGVMVHELGHHIFGWIDLYNTKNATEGIGPWDVMGTGNWGKMASQPYDGETPVLPSAYTKKFSKWITPVDAGNGTGPPVNLTSAGASSATAANTACIAKTGNSAQCFLVEARANIGYDKGLQGRLDQAAWAGGIAIWHINEGFATNENDVHRRVDLEAANNANGIDDSTYADAKVLWRQGRVFGHWSVPNSRYYNDTGTHWVVMDIQKRAQGMSASVVKDGQLTVTIEPPEAVTAGALWKACTEDGHCRGWLPSDLTIPWYPGNSTIEFKSLEGWTRPATLQFTLEPNGNVALTAAFAMVPEITSLHPTSGKVGDTVTISGTGFGAQQSTSTVAFNGTGASAISSWSDTSIVVKVPTGATTGDVVVTVNGVASNGVAFTVSVGPVIKSLNPTSGKVGDTVTISGTGFGAQQLTSTVTFNGTGASTISSWSDTAIVVKVPAGATTGNVVVTVNGVASNGVTFTVVSLGPVIKSLNPSSGQIGDTVTISGTGFGAETPWSTVQFNGPGAVIVTWSDTSIVAKVPIGATTGNVVVTVYGVDSKGVTFTVVPFGDCINDPFTGLCWDTKASSTSLAWDAAIAYCVAKDARLPTIEELITFATEGEIRQNPGLDRFLYSGGRELRPPLEARGFEFGGNASIFSSSTPYYDPLYNPWVLWFNSSFVTKAYTQFSGYYVRCVRGGQ